MNMMQSASPIPSETVEMEFDTISIIELILNQLEGKMFDPATNSYKMVGARIMNTKGVKTTASFLSAYLSRDKFLSVLNIEEIKDITVEVTDSFRNILTINYKEFGIDKANLSLALAIIEHTVYVNLKRSLDGRTLDHIQNMVKVNEADRGGGFRLPSIGGLMGNNPEPQQQGGTM